MNAFSLNKYYHIVTAADILTFNKQSLFNQKGPIKKFLINDNPRIYRMEQLITDERFTGGLTYFIIFSIILHIILYNYGIMNSKL